jgi:hypothetical protein
LRIERHKSEFTVWNASDGAAVRLKAISGQNHRVNPPGIRVVLTASSRDKPKRHDAVMQMPVMEIRICFMTRSSPVSVCALKNVIRD